MRLNARSQFHQGADLVIGETGCVTSVEAFSPHRAAACASLDDHTLIAETAFNDLAGSGRDDEVIGIGGTGDNRLAQTWIGIDDRLTTPAGERVSGEEDTRNRSLHHALHHHRQLYRAVIDALGSAIAQRAGGP